MRSLNEKIKNTLILPDAITFELFVMIIKNGGYDFYLMLYPIDIKNEIIKLI